MNVSMVSILILLEVPLQLDIIMQDGSEAFSVSILILLEVPLQPTTGLEYNVLFSSFNPYFTGSTTSTQKREQLLQDKLKFQSLFYWKYHFNTENRGQTQ